MAKTTIEVSDTTWEALNSRKKRGESFDEVIRREFNISEAEA